jgi:hypothetical protein
MITRSPATWPTARPSTEALIDQLADRSTRWRTPAVAPRCVRSTAAIRESSTGRPIRRRRPPCPGRRHRWIREPRLAPFPATRNTGPDCPQLQRSLVVSKPWSVPDADGVRRLPPCSLTRTQRRLAPGLVERRNFDRGRPGRRGDAGPGDRGRDRFARRGDGVSGARIGDRTTHQQRRAQPYPEQDAGTT